MSEAVPSGHLPVMLREVLNLFTPVGGGPFLDCTFGGGGHSAALLATADHARVVALDCDPDAAPRAAALATRHPQRFVFHNVNYVQLASLGAEKFRGILFDLGVSSFQLDNTSRGFSFREDAPADMRMDPRAGESAAEFLEHAERADLVRAIRDYGEEARWHKVVTAIIAARGSGRLATTEGFARVVADAVGPVPTRGRRPVHPATRSFQGVRIAVNRELESLHEALPMAFDKLLPGGVLAVISFHSLEDRIVKRFFNRMAGRPEHGHDSRPQDERVRQADLLTRRPLRPAEDEIERNPRSRSARLRALCKAGVSAN